MEFLRIALERCKSCVVFITLGVCLFTALCPYSIHPKAAKSATFLVTFWAFPSRVTISLAVQVCDVPSSPQRGESYPGKELEGRSGAVNHSSLLHSHEWRAAPNLHNIVRTCESSGWHPSKREPTPIHMSREDWGQPAERPRMRNPQKKKERRPPPVSLLLQIREH